MHEPSAGPSRVTKQQQELGFYTVIGQIAFQQAGYAIGQRGRRNFFVFGEQVVTARLQAPKPYRADTRMSTNFSPNSTHDLIIIIQPAGQQPIRPVRLNSIRDTPLGFHHSHSSSKNLLMALFTSSAFSSIMKWPESIS